MATAVRQLKLKDAIAALRARMVSPGKAIKSLSRLMSIGEIIELFQHYFPVEYAGFSDLRLTEDDNIGAIAGTFFRLIHRHKFPVPDFYFEEVAENLDAGESMLTYIPLWPFFSEWWDEDARDWRLVHRLLLVLDGSLKAFSDVDHRIERVLDDLPPAVVAEALRASGDFHYEGMRYACKRERSPLKHLVGAWEILHHESANTWISLTDENCGYETPNWSKENIDWLSDHFAVANRMIDEMVQLDRWLQEDHSHVHRLIKFWQKTRGKRQRVRAQIGVPLVDIFAD